MQTTNPPEVSHALVHPAGLAWVAHHTEFFALVGGLLSVINPSQYTAGVATLEWLAQNSSEIGKGSHLAAILEVWNVPFGVITVINNWDTPTHRDTGGTNEMFDILMALGRYRLGELQVPGLGIKLHYCPGVMVILVSKILLHGAVFEGDRACVVFHSKSNILQFIGLKTEWTNVHTDFI